MDSSNPPQQPNHGEILTVKDIIDTITDLFDCLSKVELPIDPQITPVRDGNIRSDQKGNGSKGRNKKKDGWRFGKRKVNGNDNHPKTGSIGNGGNNTNENNDETGSSNKKNGSSSSNENDHNGETGRRRHSDENFTGSSSSGNRNTENNGTGSSSSMHSSNGDSISTGRSLPNGYSHSSKSNPFEKLCSDLHYMKSTFNKLKEFEHDLGKQTRILHRSLKVIIENMERDPASFRSKHIQSKLREITRVVFNLKCQIPLPHKLSSTRSDASRYHQNINGINVVGNRNHELPNLHMNAKFHSSSAFKEIQEIFSDLEINRKICLLSFAVFPENAPVKKRLLMYWWIGEGFVRPEAVEENVKEILKEFTVKGLIYPVNKKGTPEPNIFKMAPLVRSAVIFLAKNAGFFDYDDYGNPTMKTSYWNRTCLGEAKEEASPQAPENLEKLQTLFNVSERFPDFTFKWFSKMKELKVLYLGRWESTAERHIEVESTEFLKDLRSMKQLRLLSFQGISRIEELHSSICKLSNLTILDLRACYNLEVLPDNIDSLKNLTHLDISECYLLDRMPKKLSSLSKLQVLKGFVISDAEKGSTCTLDELSVLKNLRKLSININREVFILEDLISALQNFKELQSLKVAWGGGFSRSKPVDNIEQRSTGEEKSKATKHDKKGDNRKDEAKSTSKIPERATDSKKEEGNAEKSLAKNQENRGDNEKMEGNASDSMEKTQDKEQKSSTVKSIATNQDKRGDNKKEESDETKSVAGNLDRKGENEIEEICEAKSMTRNQDKESTSAAKSLPINVDKEEIGAEKPTVITHRDKRNKKKVEFAEEPKTPNLGKGGAIENQESHAGKSMASNQDNGGDNKKSESGAPRPARLPSKLPSFKRLVSLSSKQLKDEAPNVPKLPSKLQKLDLQCFPENEPPSWLIPENLNHLEKLYIRGGRLRNLGEFPKGKNNNCNVRILRLKYLSELKVNWMELQAFFPKLIYLEKFRCPKITFCPCDGTGAWKSQTAEW